MKTLDLGSPLIRIALTVAGFHHAGDRRLDGKTSHMNHVMRVALACQDKGMREPAVGSALLHDTREHNPGLTDDKLQAQLRLEGMGEQTSAAVCRLVDRLTRRESETYFDYISRVCEDPEACEIKIEDIGDNSHPTREGGCHKGIVESRYQRALKMLNAALDEHCATGP